MKSFRGLMKDGDIDTIPLHTNDGSIGYKIVKFRLMGFEPGGSTNGVTFANTAFAMTNALLVSSGDFYGPKSMINCINRF